MDYLWFLFYWSSLFYQNLVIFINLHDFYTFFIDFQGFEDLFQSFMGFISQFTCTYIRLLQIILYPFMYL